MNGGTARGAMETARSVQGMFARVAGRYDFLNHLLSLNVDRWWRARTVKRVRGFLARPNARAMDLCCGTGDMVVSLEAARGAAVLGSDFCHPMLIEASRKLTRRALRSPLVEADALRLPLPDASLDLVTAAFGFRNLANYASGLEEMRRVLKPGGAAAILEFSQPRNAALAALYEVYSRYVLPRIGGAISGDPSAYVYLPESVRRFPGPEELEAMMRAAGFREVTWERMTGGIVALHIGVV
jgi:demethylmenaquinone methyltransferase / 2-methoxy-6-polyprenyl-1,4-benzoquinol methylase